MTRDPVVVCLLRNVLAAGLALAILSSAVVAIYALAAPEACPPEIAHAAGQG
jgi:hypothetical protein